MAKVSKWATFNMSQEDMKEPIFVPELQVGEVTKVMDALNSVPGEMVVKGYKLAYEEENYTPVNSNDVLVYKKFTIKLENGSYRWLEGKVLASAVSTIISDLLALSTFEGSKIASVTVK